jgi:hypothetical protein
MYWMDSGSVFMVGSVVLATRVRPLNVSFSLCRPDERLIGPGETRAGRPAGQSARVLFMRSCADRSPGAHRSRVLDGATARIDTGSNNGVAMEAFNAAGVRHQSPCQAMANAGRNPLARWC